MSNAEIADISRLPRAIAAGSVPCLNSDALRLIWTSNSPGALLSSCSFITVHIFACQSSGTAGVEIRSSTLFWARAASGNAQAAASAAPEASARRRDTEVGIVLLLWVGSVDGGIEAE